jgi:hypothetical protein
MWLGMTSDDFEIGQRTATVVYRPTGLVLEQPAPVPHGDIQGPTIFTNQNDPTFRLEVTFWGRFDRYRTDQGITPEIYDDLGVVEFRKKYGSWIELQNARSVGESKPAWTRKLVQEICNLKFYEGDISGYRRGGRPRPNQIEVLTSDIPEKLRGLYRNSYA